MVSEDIHADSEGYQIKIVTYTPEDLLRLLEQQKKSPKHLLTLFIRDWWLKQEADVVEGSPFSCEHRRQVLYDTIFRYDKRDYNWDETYPRGSLVCTHPESKDLSCRFAEQPIYWASTPDYKQLLTPAALVRPGRLEIACVHGIRLELPLQARR